MNTQNAMTVDLEAIRERLAIVAHLGTDWTYIDDPKNHNWLVAYDMDTPGRRARRDRPRLRGAHRGPDRERPQGPDGPAGRDRTPHSQARGGAGPVDAPRRGDLTPARRAQSQGLTPAAVTPPHPARPDREAAGDRAQTADGHHNQPDRPPKETP